MKKQNYFSLLVLLLLASFSINKANAQCKPEAGNNTGVCGLAMDLNAVPANASAAAQWTIHSEPVGANVTFIDDQSFATEVLVTEYGVYEFVIEETFAACNDYDTIKIEFIRIPDIDAGDPQYICGWRTQMEAIMDPSGTSTGGNWLNAPVYWTDSAFWHDTPQDTLGIGDIANQDAAEQSSPIAYITHPVPEQICSDTVMMVWQEYSTGVDFTTTHCYTKDTLLLYFFNDMQVDDNTLSIETEVCGIEVHLTSSSSISCAQGYWVDSLGTVIAWDPGYNYANVIATNSNFGQNAFAYVIENGWFGASNNPVCSDTSEYTSVTFVQQPQVDACPGCYRLENTTLPNGDFVASVRTDTVCFDDYEDFYQLNPFKNIGEGYWTKSGAGTFFANDVMGVSTVQYDSLYANIFNSSSSAAVGNYYTLIWRSSSTSNGCEDRDTLLLSIAKNPSAEIGFRRPYCNGTSAEIWAEEDLEANPTEYNWNIADNYVVDSTESGVSTDVNDLTEGSHYVRWNGYTDCDELAHQIVLTTGSDWGCVSHAGIVWIIEPEIPQILTDNTPATYGFNDGVIRIIDDSLITCDSVVSYNLMHCWVSSTLQADAGNNIPSFVDQINGGALCVVDSLYGLYSTDSSYLAIDYLFLGSLDSNVAGPSSTCKDTVLMMVNTSTEVLAVANNDLFNVYPNPAKNRISITFSNINVDVINIIDINGKVVKSVHAVKYTENMDIDISDMEQGVYFIKIGNYTEKFVKIK